MLNLRTDIPVKEDVIEQVEHLHAQIRDLLFEQEQLLKLSIGEDLLLTRDEVAIKLRCEPKKIPKCIPKIRIGNNYLYELKDVNAFVRSKKKA